jgi:predicted cation transporter
VRWRRTRICGSAASCLFNASAREAILALLISGGMLIPGNIPNVVSAGALRIGSTEWARVGVPMGLVLMGIYFAVIK